VLKFRDELLPKSPSDHHCGPQLSLAVSSRMLRCEALQLPAPTLIYGDQGRQRDLQLEGQTGKGGVSRGGWNLANRTFYQPCQIGKDWVLAVLKGLILTLTLTLFLPPA
jgi:hypothetical protein